jgi:ubiquitin-protein ligase E3 C
LCKQQLPVLDSIIEILAQEIDIQMLSAVVQDGQTGIPTSSNTTDESIWLVARFIHLGRNAPESSKSLDYLGALYTQLAAFAPEIGLRMGVSDKTEPSEPRTNKSRALKPLDPYVSAQLLSLGGTEGIASILRDFSSYITKASGAESRGTSILAGLFLTIMTCFPAQADETRMKLFLEQVPTPSGNVPLVQILWRTMSQTATFARLGKGQDHTIEVLKSYLSKGSPVSDADEQDWRVILLFLELYTFVLRLSDDEEFLAGLSTDRLQMAPKSPSRIQACSLTIAHVKQLTTLLKHTAYALYSNGPDLFQAQARLFEKRDPNSSKGTVSPLKGAANDLDSLKGTVTAALKMLYERDSRLHFLPPDFWLMVDKFDKDSFINAVVEEEMAQREAEAEADSESDVASDNEEAGADPRTRMTAMHSRWHNERKERRLAEMGPRLEVLKHMPFVVPFETRVKIFRKFIKMDKDSREGGSFTLMDSPAKHHAQIRRGLLFEDAYNAFFKIGDGLKDLISITFIDKFGSPEAGIDGGGVTKEFLTSVIAEAFGGGDVDLNMFTSNSTGLVYPNPTAIDVLREQLRQMGIQEGSPEWNEPINELLKRYEFLGRIFGKCMYEGILVDVAFAGFFLLKWPSPGRNEPNSYKGSVNDLRDMDEELYRGLMRLKNHEGDVSELGIDFTITDQISRPGQPSKTITRNLIPNGDETLVTNDNRLLYNSYVARHRLVLQPALQTQAFLRGLRAMIKPSWLSMFNQSELQRLEGGDSSEIDVEDLRRNTIYSGLYAIGDDGLEHPTVRLFWKVMNEFTDAQRRDVIKYVSSTPRAPLLGFSQLYPKFSIRDSGRDEDRLPSTSTCVNLLKLPIYTKESTLREKLLYAVTSGAGFDLS